MICYGLFYDQNTMFFSNNFMIKNTSYSYKNELYQFNRQELLQKAKDRYHNCAGKEKSC